MSAPAEVGAPPAPEPTAKARIGLRSELGWFSVVLLTSSVVAALPLVFNRRFYYSDDTQTASVGFWKYAGELIRTGQFGWLQPELWVTGNGAIDPQHGNWSPIVQLVALLTTTAPDLNVFAALVKVVFLVLAACGSYLLARTFVSPSWAAVAAIIAPFGGVTTYIDSPSWVVLLFSFTLLVYFCWALRAFGRLTPIPAIVFAVLLVGLGFAQSVIMLGIITAVFLAVALVRRQWSLAWMIALVGAVAALFAAAVFLPSALAAGDTYRDQLGIANDEIFQGSLDALSLAQFPTAQPPVAWGWGPIAPVPMAYVTWMLILLPFVPWRAVYARRRTDLLPLLIVAGVTVLLLTGPTLLGPTRWPFRYVPLITLAIAIILSILYEASAQHGWRVNRPRIALAVLILGWGAFQTFSNATSLKATAVGTVVSAVALISVLLLWRRAARSALVTLAACVLTIVVATGQHWIFPSPGTPDFNTPSSRTQLESVQSAAVPPSAFVGTLRAADPSGLAYADEVLLGNAWLFGDTGVQNLYAFLGRKNYSNLLCIDYLGQTCSSALRTYFTEQPTTGMLLVDQLGLNSLIVAKSTAEQRRELLDDVNPATGLPGGWHVAAAGEYTETWVRDQPLACDTGITWTSPGVEARVVDVRTDAIDIAVDAAPASGGIVAFCRLEWTGYEVSNGTQPLALDGYLLGIEVTDADAKQVVTVSFRPPGSQLVTGSLVGAGLAALVASSIWFITLVRNSRRRQRKAMSTARTATFRS